MVLDLNRDREYNVQKIPSILVVGGIFLFPYLAGRLR